MSWHMSPRYGHGILVSGYPVLTAVNWPYCKCAMKRCGLGKTRLRHPSLPFDSLPYPTRTICRRVRTYARSITWQPNEKRLTIFHEYGALSHARFARAGAPLKFNLKPYFLGETTVFSPHFCNKLVHAQAASVASPSHDTLQSVVVPGDVTAETWRLTLVA